ncbi:hypothetical protein [Streptomyces sp. SID161]|uniref:hypothetical protein n=1 Tax=Streptomyces sp. SID161 TaxID=2690251 RepID=UPI00136A6E8A|nr:hypothetical protein [Streptomyces sp. SID161]MYW43069.1 hypothetical protein [Streptomyces sp. SID161]
MPQRQTGQPEPLSRINHFEPPIQVESIDAAHLVLGRGADRQNISRGEVRNLKQFERRLGEKSVIMKQLAEHTQALKAHADAQAKRVTFLLDAAKSVKDGGRLTSQLTKLQDAATTQAHHAAELYKRALRASEACVVLYSNVSTRYDDMYYAVVNSPETAPAELRFYKG